MHKHKPKGKSRSSSRRSHQAEESGAVFPAMDFSFSSNSRDYEAYAALRSASPAERMNTFIRLVKSKDRSEWATVISNSEQKSKQKADSLRNRGNAYFRTKEYGEALSFYTQSIAFAPYQSETLALGYANRAAVSKEMGRFLECILDCQRALATNYPESSQYKIYYRQGQCYKMLEQDGKAMKSFNTAFALLEATPNLTVEMKQIKSKIGEDMKYWDIDQTEEEFTDLMKNCKVGVLKFDVPNLGNDINPEIPAASNSIALQYNSTFGRHLVATRDIEIGEVLMVEEPYAAVLMPECESSHCSHCFKLCRTLIPCQTCTWAMFCSDACLKESASYHEFECTIHHGFTETEKNNYLPTVLRCVTVPGIDKLTAYFKEKDSASYQVRDQRTAGFNKDNKLVSDDINAAVNLFNSEPKDLETYLGVGLDVAKVFLKFQLDKLPIAYDLGGYMLQICRALNFNGIGVMEYHKQKGFTANLKPIAASIYPTFSLINNSCNENIFYHFYGKTLVLRAGTFIKKGSQIYQNSAQSFLKYPKEVRQKFLLKRYNYKCRCEACENNWPTQEFIPFVPSFDLTNPSDLLKNKQYLPLYVAIMKHGIGNFEEGWRVTTETLKYFTNMIQWLHKNDKYKCQMYHIMRECVRFYYMMQGNHVNDVEDDGLRCLPLGPVTLEIRSLPVQQNIFI